MAQDVVGLDADGQFSTTSFDFLSVYQGVDVHVSDRINKSYSALIDYCV